MDIKKVQENLAQFAKDRDWDQFHSPKNLAMALAGEVAEIVELFQWLSEKQSRELKYSEKGKQEIAEEIADVMIYLMRLADKLEIDIEEVVWAKIRKNAEKYPVELAKGNATKYNKRTP